MSEQFKLGVAGDQPVTIDLPLLMKTKLALFATSGAGKSETIRKLCSIVTPSHAVILLDPEGEYEDLRNTMPFVLAGPGGEAAASVETADVLAARLLETGVSAIVNIFELTPSQRGEYVRRFLMALVDAPKKLWPSLQGASTLVIVDEAHMFSPERGYAPSVASEAMASMATRGRKRGFGFIMATPRPAALSNETAALCQNLMIGRSMPQDHLAILKLLGITGKKEGAEFSAKIRKIPVGDFYAFGTAFGVDEATLFHVDAIPGSKTRQNSQVRRVPPTPEAVKSLLPQFADLPKEAAEKAQTIESLRAEIRDLRKAPQAVEVSAGPVVPKVDADKIQKLKERLMQLAAIVAELKRYQAMQNKRWVNARSLVRQLADLLIEDVDSSKIENAETIQGEAGKVLAEIIRLPAKAGPPEKPRMVGAEQGDVKLPSGERNVLRVLAQYPEGLSRSSIGVFSGYSAPATRNAYVQRLQQKGYASTLGDVVKITDAGIQAVGEYEPLPTGNALRAYWTDRLPKGEGEVLRVLCENSGGMTREQIGEATGYTASSTRNAYIQRLAAKFLVTATASTVCASEALFD